MNSIEDWKDMVRTLAKDGDEILKSNNKLTAHRYHMASALLIEVVELMYYKDRKNQIEELGDIAFYVEGITQTIPVDIFNIELSKTRPINIRHSLREMLRLGAEIADLSKKEFIYRKEINEQELSNYIVEFNVSFESYLHQNSLDAYNVLNINWLKLSDRYKGLKYSDQQAQERADKK